MDCSENKEKGIECENDFDREDGKIDFQGPKWEDIAGERVRRGQTPHSED